MSNLLEDLNWRYATKKFDPNKKISAEDFETIKEAINLSPTSYGLQLYKVLIVEDEEIRKQLQPASWGQSQIVDADKLFVFCNYKNIKDEDIIEFADLKAEKLGMPKEKMKGYSDFIIAKLGERTAEENANWTAKQAYIALGNLMHACAALRIDSCPMEGFEADKYDEILGLSAQNLEAAVVATVGYRSEEDQTAYAPKVRKALSEVFHTV